MRLKHYNRRYYCQNRHSSARFDKFNSYLNNHLDNYEKHSSSISHHLSLPKQRDSSIISKHSKTITIPVQPEHQANKTTPFTTYTKHLLRAAPSGRLSCGTPCDYYKRAHFLFPRSPSANQKKRSSNQTRTVKKKKRLFRLPPANIQREPNNLTIHTKPVHRVEKTEEKLKIGKIENRKRQNKSAESGLAQVYKISKKTSSSQHKSFSYRQYSHNIPLLAQKLTTAENKTEKLSQKIDSQVRKRNSNIALRKNHSLINGLKTLSLLFLYNWV